MFANEDGSAGAQEAVTLTNLDWGKTYYLVETQAATGYEKLNDDICFSVGMDGTVSINSTGHAGWLTSATDTHSGTTTYTLAIPNGLAKDFSFHKIWYPITGEERLEWQKDITVTLYKGNNVEVAEYTISMSNGSLTATGISKLEGGTVPELVINDPTDHDYSFTIKNLPFGDTFYLVESDLDNNFTKYGKVVEDAVQVTPGATRATEDTPYIINSETGGYELPAAGGSGTLPYTLGGLMLVIASALMYGFRMRRRERRVH